MRVDGGGRPPRALEALLRLVLPPQDRESFPAELAELHRERSGRSGRLAADLWYTAQVVELALRRAAAGAAGLPGRLAGAVTGGGSLVRDVRRAGRSVARRPLFAIVAVLSLALGLGANTAIFSLVNAVLLRPLPVERPDELVQIYTSDSDGDPYSAFSYPDYADLAEGSAVFADVMGYEVVVASLEEEPGAPTRVVLGEAVTGSYFPGLGVRPARGRLLGPADDDAPGAEQVVVLSHRFWSSRLGSDPDVVGRTLRLNGRPMTVVGVAAPDFQGLFPAVVPDFWAPMAMIGELKGSSVHRLESRGSRSMFVVARLADGVVPERASRWLDAFAGRLAQAHPETNEGRTMTLLPRSEVRIMPQVDRALAPVAGLLVAVVVLVLVITCANLAGFLLARAEDRRRDVAVRTALGARRGWLVRGLLVETLLLAAVAGGLGVFLADATIRAFLALQPPLPIPINLDLGLDGRVLAFSVAVTALAGVAFGILPALRATSGDVAPALRGSGDGGRRGSAVRNGLVVGQVALSFVLLIGAGLFLRSLQEARSVDPGFDTGPGAILWPNLQLAGIEDPEERRALWDAYERRLLAHPDVEAVAMTDLLPLSAGLQTRELAIPGHESGRDDGLFAIDRAAANPGFWEAMGIELVSGRTFREGDGDGPGVMVVSRAFERRFFPEGAVGRTVMNRDGDPAGTIVGVVADTKVRTLGEAPRPRIYTPVDAVDYASLQVVVRGRGTSGELLARARSVLEELRPGVPLLEAKPMERHLALLLLPPRMAAGLLGGFGALALLLAAVGVFGLVRHTVAQRTREMGIRISVGARPRDVLLMVVGGGMRLVLVGGLIGGALGLGAGRLLSGYLIGVGGTDPATFVAIPFVLLGVGLAASLLPAWRATRVDPAEVLRAE